MSKASEVEDLVRAIKATGTHDVSSVGAHHKVTDSAGTTVYILPKTPSDRRWRDNAVRGLVKAGVFEKDPKKMNGESKRTKHHLADPEIQAKKVAAVKARHAHFAELTRDIRTRIEPLITKVGGWGMRSGQVTASELGAAAMYWGRDRADVFGSQDGAKSSAQANIKQGGTLSEKGVSFWDAFVTAWESAEDPQRWYFDLVREMKGLPKTNVIIAGAVQPETTQKKRNLRRAGRVRSYVLEEEKKHPLEPPTIIGSLALQAVALMAAGSDPSDRREIIETGERILLLETLAEEVREEEL